MAQPERNMAEGTAPGSESDSVGPQVGPASVNRPESVQAAETRTAGIVANASLADTERLQVAKGLLGTQLRPEQEKAILEAHKVGSGETGKDKNEAGVYNYTRTQLLEKARILKEAGFSEDQRRALLESGIAGRLSPADFAAVNPGFNPNTYTDPKVKDFAQKLQTWGNAGRIDEVVTSRFKAQISKLAENLEIDLSEADDLQSKVEAWQTAADDRWLPQAERAHLREMANREGGGVCSVFSMAKHVYEYYMALPMPTDPARQQELTDLRNQSRTEVQNLINRAHQAGVLDDVRTRALEFYKQYKAAKRHDKWGRDKQQIIDYARQGYHEAFWADSPALKYLEGELRGAARYLYDGVVSEAYKELTGDEQAPSLNVISKEEFHKIKEQRRRDRLSEKKYEVNNYYGRRSYELTAENAAELPEAILEWVRDQLAEIPNTDMQTVDGKLKEIRAEAEQLLGTNRVHLEKDEGQKELTEDHPDFLRAKAAFEAVTDSVGYEKIISWDEKIPWEGGGEVAASYAERFAAGYVGHHDAIYLMRRVARILLKLRTHKEGTYWTGHPFSEEKVDLGYMRKYRQELQEEIEEDAATHDIFTETVFAENQDLFQDLMKHTNPDGTIEDNTYDVDNGYTGFFELRERYKLQYSFNDPLERILLDPGDIIRQRIAATGNAEALSRHDIRVKVFRDIKARRDVENGLANLSPEQRVNAIRRRIIRQMMSKTGNSLVSEYTKKARDVMEAARQQHDPVAYDKAMWEWVERYNRDRIKEGLQIEGDANWYPSDWDMIKMKIDRAEKVLDRKLTDEQINAMYEKVRLDNLTDDRMDLIKNEVRFGFIVARDYALLEMEDSMYGGIRTRVRDSKIGEIIDPDHKVMRVFDIVKGRLKTAIAEEWDELEKLKSTMGAAIRQAEQQKNFAEAKRLQIELDKKMLDAQFLVTHALKAAGFVDGELPVWNGQLRSDTAINFFGSVLKAYGVNVAFGEGISHNSKDLLYELLERGRRAWQSEWDIAAEKFMVGNYPVPKKDYDTNLKSPTHGQLVPQFDSQGKAIQAEPYREDVWGEKKPISERNRIVNPGAPSEHQGITDTRFNSSTSGGLAVAEFTDKIADLLFAPPLAKLGVVSIAGLHGYIKGLDEVQAIRRQKIFTSSDAELSARERVAAYNARKALNGGKFAEGKSGPGLAIEPFHGAFKVADWIQKFMEAAQRHKLTNTYNYAALMQQGLRTSDKDYSEFMDDEKGGTLKGLDRGGSMADVPYKKGDLERLRQLTYSDHDGMNKTELDDLYNLEYGIFDYFQDYLKARKGCIQSRGGRALRSWEEENHKTFYAFRREMREAIMGKKENGKWVKKPEHGFIIRLGYSPEVASESALRMLETVLMDADYLVLRGYEVKQRIRDGVDILSSALTDQETREGFQVNANGVTTKTLVIPDEKDWGNIVEPRIRKALEKIRRRGLLEFMREEGYKIYERDNTGKIRVNQKDEQVFYEILGQKLPPLVQDRKLKEDVRRVKNAFNPIGIF